MTGYGPKQRFALQVSYQRFDAAEIRRLAAGAPAV